MQFLEKKIIEREMTRLSYLHEDDDLMSISEITMHDKNQTSD